MYMFSLEVYAMYVQRVLMYTFFMQNVLVSIYFYIYMSYMSIYRLLCVIYVFMFM